MKIFAKNKKAYHDYKILETFEAGMVLRGHEVKAIKNNQMSLKGAFVSIDENSVTLKKASISLYKKSGLIPGYDPEQDRKLLLNKNEIKTLLGKLKQKGLTLVPLTVYTKNNKLKIEIGVAMGKKKYDKREDIKKKDIDKSIRKELKYKF